MVRITVDAMADGSATVRAELDDDQVVTAAGAVVAVAAGEHLATITDGMITVEGDGQRGSRTPRRGRVDIAKFPTHQPLVDALRATAGQVRLTVRHAASAPALLPAWSLLTERKADAPPPLPPATTAEEENRLEAAADASARCGHSPGTDTSSTRSPSHRPTAVPLPDDVLGPGQPLPQVLRRRFQGPLDVDLTEVRVHDGPRAHATAAGIDALAFTVGRDIALGPNAPRLDSHQGLHLIGHELAHVAQQARGTGVGLVQRQSNTNTFHPADIDPATPDDSRFEDGVDPHAEEKNIDWSGRLRLLERAMLRDFDPWTTPHAYANRVLRAQGVLRANGVARVEDATLGADGIFGPRTFLALLRVARDPDHPARATIQGLGFNLEQVTLAGRSEEAALAILHPAEVRLHTNIEIYGESATRYYDRFYSMKTSEDRSAFDNTLFGGEPPKDLRAQDRVQILQRLYGTAEQRLQGTLEVVVAQRDFLSTQLDSARAVGRDTRRGVANGYYFEFIATSPERTGQLLDDLDLRQSVTRAGKRLDEASRTDLVAALNLLGTQSGGPRPDAHEVAGMIVAIYLPVPDSTRVRAIAATVLAERAEREQAAQEANAANNREVARQRADRIMAILDDDQTNHLILDAQLQDELERASRERMFFDDVLDVLVQHGRMEALFERTEGLGGTGPIGLLVRAARAGRYQNHARVLHAQQLLIDRTGGLRRHKYVLGTTPRDGVVLLDGSTRVDVGRVTGDVDDLYLRDEDREQLKPEPQRRMTAALEAESRAYVGNLLAGHEPSRNQEQISKVLIERAKVTANLNLKHDMEDVVWEESVRVLGVRQGADTGDGVQHYEIEYERVQRVRGGALGDPAWDTRPGVEGSRKWASESAFEYDMFWYAYSQSADVMIAAAKIVTLGAVLVVAWEVGVIAALVAAGGGAIPVGLSIGASLAIYWLTHERHTIEGLLLAGVEGYLGALGFRIFAPLGAAAARLVIPATLEEVTFGRAMATWLVRKGVTGAAVGGSLNVASLFMHDLVSAASTGAGFSSLSAYVRSASIGVVLGAAFEIGGSLLLAPLFRNANSSVLARLDDVIVTLNQTQPRLTPGQWMAHAARGVSAARQMFETLMTEVQARGLAMAVAERVAEVGRRWLVGLRVTIHHEVLELAQANISREAVDGLERLIRIGATRLGDDAVATLLQQARRTPQRIDPWLRLLAGIDDAAVEALAGRPNQLRALVDADAAMALAARRTPTEVNRLLGQRFGHVVADLDAFATRLNRLTPTVADAVLGALATRGTGVTPRALLRASELGEALDDQFLGGLERLLQGGTNPVRLDGVLDTLTVEQLGPFVRGAHSAEVTELIQMLELISNFEAGEVGWALQRPVAQAHALLGSLNAQARKAITNVTAAEAQALVAALTPARVNAALGGGTAGALRGSHLRTLRSRWTDRSVTGYLDWAAGDPHKLARVARVAEGFDVLAQRGLMPPTPTTATTILLDSNSSIGINLLIAGTPFTALDLTRQNTINALRRERGLPRYVDPPAGVVPRLEDIIGAGADLRATPTAAAELAAGLAHPGRADLLGRLGGIAPATTHADYAAVLDDLIRTNIGRAKGAVDRTIIADALLTPRPGGGTPVLVTGDKDVVTGLAIRFAYPTRFTPIRNAGTAFDQLTRHPDFSSGYTIQIHGHPLRIVYR